VLKPEYSSRFKKDIKRYQHKQDIIDELNEVIQLLLKKKKLPEKHVDHPLKGNYVGHRECHVRPDVLLIYKVYDNVLAVERLGSHSDLF